MHKECNDNNNSSAEFILEQEQNSEEKGRLGWAGNEIAASAS